MKSFLHLIFFKNNRLSVQRFCIFFDLIDNIT